MEDVVKKHFGWIKKQVLRYKIPIVVIVLVAGFALGGFFGYRFYRRGIESRAQMEFTTVMKYFDAPVQTPDFKSDRLSIEDVEIFSSEEEKWTRVAESFRKGYENNTSSGIAPMFLAFQSEALINLGKFEEAIEVLKNAVDILKDDTIKDSYNVKLALMWLDSKDENVQKEGLKLLQSISSKSESPVRDLALYHLGEYYWVKKNFTEAKNYWSTLVSEYGEKVRVPSEWAKLALEKLKLIAGKF